MSSPNFPGYYSNNLHTIQTIQAKEGLILSLEFTAFDVEFHPACSFDHLTITDGDGTVLMERGCSSNTDSNLVIGGQSLNSSLPATIKSRSNIVNLIFVTNGDGSKTGWNVRWGAVTQGKCKTSQKMQKLSLKCLKDVIDKFTYQAVLDSLNCYHHILSGCSIASPGSSCTDLEVEECKYEYIGGDHCCCGQCSNSSWLNLACVLDSTTGDRIWQLTQVLCPTHGCGSEGE